MRKNRQGVEVSDEFRLMIIDDDEGIVDSITVLFRRAGYFIDGFTDPLAGVEALKSQEYDLLILDFFMLPIHGDETVELIRKFDKELYILLLTGHKDLAPPINTIKKLDIQGYCEKSDRTDQLLLLVESGIKSISQMRIIKKFRDGLNSILGAVPKIYQLQPIGSILEEILTQILPFVNSSHAFIMVDDLTESGNSGKSIFRGIGNFNVDVDDFFDKLDSKMIEAVGAARTNRCVTWIPGGVILPLINDGNKSIGVIFVNGVNLDDWIKLLEIYAGQAASSINNAFLHSLVNVKNEELNRTYDQLKQRYMDTIQALRLAVDAKDSNTRGHSDRVAHLSMMIGEKLNLSEKDLEILKIGGVFHDIGKIGTADDILLKTSRLSDEETEIIRLHPHKGALILSAVSMFSDVVPIVRHHHERIDGKGYPDGLKNDDIPLASRIISVADAFDAMTSDRQYRSRLSLHDAKQQMISGKNTQFDEVIVDVFMDILASDPAFEDMEAYFAENLRATSFV